MRKSVLLTRPRAESERLAAMLADRGWDPLIEPLLEIVYLDAPLPDPAAYDGLVFTSANGVRAFAARSPERQMPVHVVGPATETAARAAGFEKIITLSLQGEGRGEGPLLHISGEHVARPVPGADRVVLYRAVQVSALTPACRAGLEKGFDAALFFSPRTAEVFVNLVVAGGLAGSLESTKALCIADSVVKCLSNLPWQDIITAKTPDEGGIRDLLDGLTRESGTHDRRSAGPEHAQQRD